MLSKMCIEGKMVPALKLEVNKNAYDVFKREQWMQEHHYRIENRCIVKILPHQNPQPHIHSGQWSAQNLIQQLHCLSVQQ